MIRAIAILLLSGCAYDPGGDVVTRAIAIRDEPAGRISGYCASACTMQIRRDCVEPSAVLAFHGPQSAKPMSPQDYRAWVDAIAGYYPEPLAAWYRTEGHDGLHVLIGARAIQMGATAC